MWLVPSLGGRERNRTPSCWRVAFYRLCSLLFVYVLVIDKYICFLLHTKHECDIQLVFITLPKCSYLVPVDQCTSGAPRSFPNLPGSTAKAKTQSMLTNNRSSRTGLPTAKRHVLVQPTLKLPL